MAFTSFGGGIGGHLHWIEGKETTIDKEKEIKTEKMVMSQAEKNDNEKNHCKNIGIFGEIGKENYHY